MDLRTLFEPASVAVIGVSRSNPFHPATVIYNKNHLRSRAKTYGVNPKGGKLFREPLYASIAEVPGPVDLAVIGVRAERVPGVLEECIRAGVKGAVVISGGFSETGRTDLQDRLKALAREARLPVVGPNCLGLFSPPHVDTLFLPPERLIRIRPGAVALVSQSGGILVDQLIKLTQEGAGLSRGVSIGNKAVLDEVDFLSFFAEDAPTRVVGLYLEGFGPGRGRDFAERVRAMDKPVVFLKSGRSPGGSRAVQSHTASLAGDYRVFREVLLQVGAIEARDETEFVSYCEALAGEPMPGGTRIGIVTASGGHGAIASDACFEQGLQIPELAEERRTALRGKLSEAIRGIAGTGNPVDLTGSATDLDFIAASRFLLGEPTVDVVVLLCLPYLPAITPDIGARVAQACREYGKPLVTYIPHIDKYGIFIEGFEANGVPVAHSVDGAVHMARALARRKQP